MKLKLNIKKIKLKYFIPKKISKFLPKGKINLLKQDFKKKIYTKKLIFCGLKNFLAKN